MERPQKNKAATHLFFISLFTVMLAQARTPVIAVLDTGLNTQHVGFQNVKIHPRSYNFAGRNPDFDDKHGHGTHIAGILALPNNTPGFEKTPEVELLVMKIFDFENPHADPMDATVRALQTAIEVNVDIINYSAGGKAFDVRERVLLERAIAKGILVVVASGNHRQNCDVHPFFPASYPINGLIRVGNMTPSGDRAPTSNFGDRCVNLFAPGERIQSSFLNGTTGALSGSSQSTAMVSRALALWMNQNPKASRQEAREALAKYLETQSAPMRRLSSANAFLSAQTSLAR
jgi:subtilisin family serine protease